MSVHFIAIFPNGNGNDLDLRLRPGFFARSPVVSQHWLQVTRKETFHKWKKSCFFHVMGMPHMKNKIVSCGLPSFVDPIGKADL